MVGAEDHHGVLVEAAAPEDVEQASDLLHEVGDVRDVGPPCATHLRLGDVELAEVDHVQEPPAGRVLLSLGNRRDLPRKSRAILVEVPETTTTDVRGTRGWETP